MTRSTIIFSALILLFNYSLSAQEFAAPISNPFGINVDTTGGIAIYTCNFADIDNDGDIDIIYPYFDENFVFAYQENIGSPKNPNFKPIEKLDFNLNMDPGFLFPDFADMNGDGLTDFIVFGSINESTGFNCTYYENKGNNDFEIVEGTSVGLPGVGYAIGVPEIVDLNQDGDLDLILSGSELEAFTDEADALYYYAQNSNPTDPLFTGWFVEPYSFEFMDTFQSVIIRAGDMDLDGDIDLLMNVSINDDQSRLMFQENISPPNEKSDFSGPQLVSQFGLPDSISGLHFLEDLDGDGDLDLLMFGELEILYYENTSCVSSNTIMDVSLCNESSYILNDKTYSESGTYVQVIPNNAGCDSTITLSLFLNNEINTDFEKSICEEAFYTWNDEEFTAAGEYERTLVRENGCDSVVTLILSVLKLDYEISVVDNSLNVEVENATIAWINCDNNTAISDEDQSVYIPEESGTYAALLKQGECEVMTECLTVTITSAVEELVTDFQILPNPAKHIIYLHGLETSEAKVKIFNSAGTTLIMKLSNNRIDISDLPPGFYYLNIALENQTIVKPFIIVR